MRPSRTKGNLPPMGLKRWNIAVVLAAAVLLCAGMTQREKPVVGELHSSRVAAYEDALAAHPDSPEKLRDLAQAYITARMPGMALTRIEHAPAKLRDEPTVEYVYARALVDQGRSADALVVEKRVLARCAETKACSEQLVMSARRYVGVLEELGKLGVDDANANPEASNFAYINATKPVSYSAE